MARNRRNYGGGWGGRARTFIRTRIMRRPSKKAMRNAGLTAVVVALIWMATSKKVREFVFGKLREWFPNLYDG